MSEAIFRLNPRGYSEVKQYSFKIRIWTHIWSHCGLSLTSPRILINFFSLKNITMLRNKNIKLLILKMRSSLCFRVLIRWFNLSGRRCILGKGRCNLIFINFLSKGCFSKEVDIPWMWNLLMYFSPSLQETWLKVRTQAHYTASLINWGKARHL